MGLRLLLLFLSALLCNLVTAFMRPPARPGIVTTLLARGFGSNEGKDPKLSKDALSCLKEAKGSLEVAQGLYFQSKLQSLKETNPLMWMTLEAYRPSVKDESSRKVHEKLVEYTWDTIAAYLPLTTPSNGAVEEAVSLKLELIAKAASFQPNASVMDVGCGNGAIVPYLKRAGADLKSYLGMDLSSQMIDAALSSNPGLAFERSNFLTWDSPTKKFDTILFNGVVQFFPSIQDALLRAASFLKPGGRLVISHVNGAEFVRGEKRGNPVTVLTEMPEVAYIKSLGDEMGADFIALDEIAPSAKYSMDEMYLCVLKIRG